MLDPTTCDGAVTDPASDGRVSSRALNRDDLPIGTRCWERDRGGDALPRGGVVIGHADLPERPGRAGGDHVICARGWGLRSKGRKANVPFLDADVIPVNAIDPATIGFMGTTERVRLARAVAAMIGARNKGSRTDDDDRDLALLRELMLPAV